MNWRLKGILAVVLLAVNSIMAAAAVPDGVGPQGILMWEKPRDMPELNFKDGLGNALTLTDFEGKTVLLNIWATWCGPCREEMPTLDAVQKGLGGVDFEVVALSIDRQMTAVKDFYQEIGVKHLHKYIDESTMAGANLGAVGIPTTLLINRQGDEIGRLVGSTEWDSPEMIAFLRTMIERSK